MGWQVISLKKQSLRGLCRPPSVLFSSLFAPLTSGLAPPLLFQPLLKLPAAGFEASTHTCLLFDDMPEGPATKKPAAGDPFAALPDCHDYEPLGCHPYSARKPACVPQGCEQDLESYCYPSVDLVRDGTAVLAVVRNSPAPSGRQTPILWSASCQSGCDLGIRGKIFSHLVAKSRLLDAATLSPVKLILATLPPPPQPPQHPSPSESPTPSPPPSPPPPTKVKHRGKKPLTLTSRMTTAEEKIEWLIDEVKALQGGQVKIATSVEAISTWSVNAEKISGELSKEIQKLTSRIAALETIAPTAQESAPAREEEGRAKGHRVLPQHQGDDARLPNLHRTLVRGEKPREDLESYCYPCVDLVRDAAAVLAAVRNSPAPSGRQTHVLSFLPAQPAVRTCVLARRWRRLWEGVVGLHITGTSAPEPPCAPEVSSGELREFVDHLFLLRSGTTLDSCEFMFDVRDDGDVPHVNLWIRHVIRCQPGD
ncbi:hypothetical protein HU200_029305 [Digitaria exilis]|uniref:Uncharacterized protein n=1 Tax=Digitaria exilis TaxID=1010633 RepID=A0A835ES30_9POAL|nr:hypothetical protein HU200_029305 [Digitaria exilis]